MVPKIPLLWHVIDGVDCGDEVARHRVEGTSRVRRAILSTHPHAAKSYIIHSRSSANILLLPPFQN
jgi:hypothetical protein